MPCFFSESTLTQSPSFFNYPQRLERFLQDLQKLLGWRRSRRQGAAHGPGPAAGAPQRVSSFLGLVRLLTLIRPV